MFVATNDPLLQEHPLCYLALPVNELVSWALKQAVANEAILDSQNILTHPLCKDPVLREAQIGFCWRTLERVRCFLAGGYFHTKLQPPNPRGWREVGCANKSSKRCFKLRNKFSQSLFVCKPLTLVLMALFLCVV